jgi:hypothetical protein
MQIKLTALLGFDVKNEEELGKLNFAARFFASIQDGEHQLWHFVRFGSIFSEQIGFEHTQERRLASSSLSKSIIESLRYSCCHICANFDFRMLRLSSFLEISKNIIYFLKLKQIFALQ